MDVVHYSMDVTTCTFETKLCLRHERAEYVWKTTLEYA